MENTSQAPYEQRILRRDGATWPRAGNPTGWAQHRIEMTGALTWFKSTQGGVHLSHKGDGSNFHVLGILIGGYAGDRSYVDAEVIITSINGLQSLRSRVTEDRRVAMAATIKDKRLVGVIFEAGAVQPCKSTGDKRVRQQADAQLVQGPAPASAKDLFQLVACNNMPVNGDYKQNCWIADWFLPTLLWPTKVPGQDGEVWMVRLEKFHLSQQSWWANIQHGLPPSDHQRTFSRVAEEVCPSCKKSSPRLFNEAFVCTNIDCSDVWQQNGAVIQPDQVLTYSDAFLQQRTRRPLRHVVYPTEHKELVRDFSELWEREYRQPMDRNEPITLQNYQPRMNFLLAGLFCPYCGMANHRVRWHEWHCRNSRCNGGNGLAFKAKGHPPLLTVDEARTIGPQPKKQTKEPDLTKHPTYQKTTDLDDFTALEFELSDGCFVAYLRPKAHTNGMPGSSDYLYEQIQRLANSGNIQLERRGLGSRGGPSLTSHFSANFGKRYVFAARVPTTPFKDADPIIQHAVDLMNKWTAPWQEATKELPANEMYLAAYLEGQRMNWHDDGEKYLGQVITTYTLGGRGEFKLQLKQKYNIGHRRVGGKCTAWLKNDPVPSGCTLEKERKELRAQLNSGAIDQGQWEKQFKRLMTDAKEKSARILDLPVHHGEIVIMYGPNTQKYLDHCVDVASPMRFALTFRHILEGHVNPEDEDEFERRLAYDVQFDPGEDWTNTDKLDQVGGEEGTQGEPSSPLPAPPPAKKQRTVRAPKSVSK